MVSLQIWGEKRMKSYLDLIPISSKIHQKQTRMTRICIVLAVFLITVIFGFSDIYIQSQRTQQIQNVGNWHYSFHNIDNENAEMISMWPEVTVSGWHDTLDIDAGYLYNGKPLAISGQDETVFKDIYLSKVSEGRYPISEKEIALSIKMKDSYNIQIGSIIRLDLPNGESCSFNVTGFVTDTSRLITGTDMLAVVTIDGFQSLEIPVNSYIAKVYAVSFSLFCNMPNTVSNIIEQFNLSEDQVSANAPLLGMLGQIDSSYVSQIYGVVLVLFFIVMLTGILMISSTLNSNVMQRTEFFGMIRCLGATKKQIMRFVRREGLHWCKIAIPVGVGVGILAVWVLSAVMKVISPVRFYYMPLFGISWISVIAGVIMGVVTVLLAARSPAKKAARVSPLEAVSGNTQSGVSVRKAAKTRFFKIETALGIHHAKMSKTNYVLMTGAFAISIVIFLAFSTIIDFMNHAMMPLKPWTPDLSIVSETNTCSIEKEMIDKIINNEMVKRAYGRMFAYDEPAVINGETHNSNIISYEENQFLWAEEKLLEGSLENTMNGDQVLFVYNEKVPVHAGDQMVLQMNGNEIEVIVSGVLSDSPLAREAETETIICSEDTFIKLTGESGYTIIDVQFKNSATDRDVSAIKILGNGELSFVDQRSANQEARNLYKSFAFLVYSFLVIIAAITIFNIINTVNISVSAKLKQYGAMRAIGMSNHQLRNMIITEAATYAISGSIVGCMIGLPLHYVIYLSMITTIWGDAWKIPLSSVSIIVAIVLVTTFLAVQGPAKRIYHMSIVETLSVQ